MTRLGKALEERVRAASGWVALTRIITTHRVGRHTTRAQDPRRWTTAPTRRGCCTVHKLRLRPGAFVTPLSMYSAS